MTEPRRIEFTLLGQTLSLRTTESRDYILSLAKYIEERVTTLKRSGMKDPTTALVLAALDITDELFKAREEGSRDPADVDKATPKEPGA
jgi:cell division protein ZapA (FtsZ GTPase activity inhibitor)